MYLSALAKVSLILAAISSSTPFSYFDNRMLVTCAIDGRRFTMLVDTGAPFVSITPETARALSLATRAGGTAYGAGAKVVKTEEATLRTFSIASRAYKNIDAEVIDLSEIKSRFHFPHLDGIVGYAILKHFATVVNVDAGTISLESRSPEPPAGAQTIPFTLADGHIPVVDGVIDGISTKLEVDSGDRSSLTLFTPFARVHRFYDRYPSKKRFITGYGIGGPIYADVFRIPSLEVFGRTLRGIVTRASRQTAGVFAGTDAGANLGTGVLRRFNIVYDYPHRRLIVWPSKFFSSADSFHPVPG